MENENVTAQELLEVIKDTEQTTTIDYCGMKIQVKNYLFPADMFGFVSDVVSLCFDEDTGAYHPEVKDFAIRCETIEKYTGIKLPDDMDERCRLAYESKLVDAIEDVADFKQMNAIHIAINSALQHKASQSIEQLNLRMGAIASAFEELENKLTDMFSGVDTGDLAKLTQVVANGGFDEGRLVDEFVKRRNDTKGGTVEG